VQLDKKTSNTQKKRIAEMLARAFYDDPMAQYVFPDAGTRDAKLPNFYEIPLRYGLHYGEVYAASSNLEGVAVWLPSEKSDMTAWRIILAGVLFNTMKMGTQAGERIGRLGTFLDRQHKLHVPKKHWYLYVLGVDPSFQGQGNASKLLQPMLERLDKEGLPAYLETNKERNVALYQHFGFEVVEESTLPGTDLVTWAMKRNTAIEVALIKPT
jgi:ribosomal protein S18 acetylase RimI-like enzyme